MRIFIFALLMAGIPFALTTQKAGLLQNAAGNAFGQSAPQATPNSQRDLFVTGDYIFDPKIKTVLFYKNGWEQSSPHLRFDSEETLSLVFDDLSPSIRNFHYTLIHHDANWQPSPLRQFEYLEGFYESVIDQYERSINTLVPYTQYRLQIPNETMRPRLPGNYLLKVFLDGDPNRVVFTRRLVIFEHLVTINASVRQATLVQFRDTHQQIRFEINTHNYNISNPNRDLRVVVLQNGRWDNAIRGLQPRSILGARLIYDHDNLLLFEAGNEFRWFDIRSLRFRSERVDQLLEGPVNMEVFLRPDRIRAFSPYLTERDINGRFEVNTHDATDRNLESDYAMVHFRLPVRSEFSHSDVHVTGALTGWVISPQNRLRFNPATRSYELNLLLKQGFYNYKYIVVDRQTRKASYAEVEGNFSMAENDYTILVYHRQPGTVFDKLIGISHVNTHER